MAPSASAFCLNLERISKLRSYIRGCGCDGGIVCGCECDGGVVCGCVCDGGIVCGHVCDEGIVDSNYSSQRPRPCQAVIYQHVGGNHIVSLPYIIAQESSLYALKQDLMDPRGIVVILRHLSNNNFCGAASCGILWLLQCVTTWEAYSFCASVYTRFKRQGAYIVPMSNAARVTVVGWHWLMAALSST